MVSYFYFPQILQFKSSSHIRLFPSSTWTWVYLRNHPRGWDDHSISTENISQFPVPVITLSTLTPFHYEVHPCEFLQELHNALQSLHLRWWKNMTWPETAYVYFCSQKHSVTPFLFLIVNQTNHVRITFTNEKNNSFLTQIPITYFSE